MTLVEFSRIVRARAWYNIALKPRVDSDFYSKLKALVSTSQCAPKLYSKTSFMAVHHVDKDYIRCYDCIIIKPHIANQTPYNDEWAGTKP